VETKIPVLRKTDLFSGLESEDLQKVSGITISENYEPGNIVFLEGDKVKGFYILAEGRAKGYRNSPSGKQQIIKILEPGDVVAEAVIFSGEGYPISLEVTEPSRLLFIPRKEFTELLKKEPDFALRMLGELSRRLRFLVGLVEDLSLKDVSARLAKYLLDRAVSKNKSLANGVEIKLKTPNHELASALGTTPETLSRNLRDLGEKGIIERDGKTVKLKNISQLQLLSAGNK